MCCASASSSVITTSSLRSTSSQRRPRPGKLDDHIAFKINAWCNACEGHAEFMKAAGSVLADFNDYLTSEGWDTSEARHALFMLVDIVCSDAATGNPQMISFKRKEQA